MVTGVWHFNYSRRTHSISSTQMNSPNGNADLNSIFTPLASKDEARKVGTLLYCLREEADDVLSLTNISTEERTKYSEVMAKLDEYFRVRKNVIFERARFNRRNQLLEKTAEEYITILFHLVDSCNYGNLRDKMLWDRLLVGIRDEGLSQRL